MDSIKEFVSKEFRDFEFKKIDSGASNKIFYRIKKDEKLFICMNCQKEFDVFFNFLKIHKMLCMIDISIPQIVYINEEYKILILEDLGNMRFDKIINENNIKELLNQAVDSLILIKNNLKFVSNKNMIKYNQNIFKTEISEFLDYFYSFKTNKKIDDDLKEEFYSIWLEKFNSLKLNFDSFVHKDFNLNNLIYLKNRKNHKKCGIIDFQDAFWGEDCWDLFSLLEDSRVFFTDKYNQYFIKYYFENINQQNVFENFKEKYFFLNCSRQVRLLGRWVKLSRKFNKSWYLDFISVTSKRLINSLEQPGMKKIKENMIKLNPQLYEN